MYNHFSNLVMAYEIALIGNFSIELRYSKEQYPNAVKDLPLILESFPDVKFKVGGDLIVELYKTDFTTNDTIEKSLLKVGGASTPTELNPKSRRAAESLLKTAVDRLKLSISQQDLVMKIAAASAGLDKSKYIEIQNVAIAVQYIYSDLDILTQYPFNLQGLRDFLYDKYDIVDRDLSNALRLKDGEYKLFHIDSLCFKFFNEFVNYNK